MNVEELLARRAARLARARLDVSPSASVSAIDIEIAGQRYSMPMTDVERVVITDRVTPLPHSHPILLGVVADQGDVFPVFDGRVWLKKPRRPPGSRTCLLLIGRGSDAFALAVDSFHSSATTPSTTRAPPEGQGWVRGVTDDGVILVDVAVLVRDPSFRL